MVEEKESSMPLLTVLMPVYNADKFLDESINSILSQTYSDFELLILDDASTDNSLKIIKAYAKEDKRIKVLVNQKNRKIFKKNFETLSRQCSVICSVMFLKKIYCHYRDGGLKGKLFFIKNFGPKNYFKIKTW